MRKLSMLSIGFTVFLIIVNGAAAQSSATGCKAEAKRVEENGNILFVIPKGDRIIKIPALDITSHGCLSDGEKYLMMTSGTDITANMRIYDVDSGRIVLEAGIARNGLKPSWNGLATEYERVLYWGDGYMVCEYDKFNDGTDSQGAKTIEDYHVLIMAEPFSRRYDVTDYGTIDQARQNMIEQFQNMLSLELESNRSLLNSLNENPIVKDESISPTGELLASFEDLCEGWLRYFAGRKMLQTVADFFNYTYPFFDLASRAGAMDRETSRKYLGRVLQILSIDPEVLPWLAKHRSAP